MIRLIQRKLIIPRGDTGSFSVPAVKIVDNSIAVFSIIDTSTKTIVFSKEVPISGETITIEFAHEETVNLPTGAYVWDIKFYQNPQYMDEELVSGDEVDSYYAGFNLPSCEIRETGDRLLLSSDSPSTTLTPAQLNVLNAAVTSTTQRAQETSHDAQEAAESAQTAAGSAQAAAASASAASSYADAAQSSATEAATYAENAAAMAENADESSRRARVAQDSAEAARDAADTAAANAAESAGKIIGLTATAETLSEGSAASASYDSTNGILTLGIPTGNSGVYIGTTAPTDPSQKVWINPDGEGVDVPIVDTTLAITGAAAESKTVGDAIIASSGRITTLETAITAIKAKTDAITVTSNTDCTTLADNGRGHSANVYNTYHQIDADTGEYVEVTYSSFRACETYFEIPEGAVIFNYLHNPAYTAANVNYQFYDENKAYLGASTIFKVTSANVHADTWENHPGTFVTVPDGAAYYRLWDSSGTFHSMVLRFATTTKVDIPDLVSLPLRGKNVLAFGDSIWGNDRTDGICDFLAKYTGATVYNGAIGGTRITDLRSSQYDSPDYVYFDGVKLIHALVTGNWTDQDSHISSVSSAYVSAETLPMLKALDLSTIDIVTIAYGHNDVSTRETAEDIKAALATIVTDLLTANPAIRIVVLTPPWRMFSSGTVDGDDYVGTGGLSLRTLGDALIEKAKALHITWCDMLTDCPWNALTKAYYLDSDSVHPNTEGNKVYAHVVSGKLKCMY